METTVAADTVPQDIATLIGDLRAEIRAFYARHPFVPDFYEVLRKMDKLDLRLAGDYERLWLMEREDTAVLKAKERADTATIHRLERRPPTVLLHSTPLATAAGSAFHSPIRATTTPTATEATQDISSIVPDRRGSLFEVGQ